MTLYLEITLNRFGFGRIAGNKVQLGFLRISWWEVRGKHSVGLEVNWHRPVVFVDIESYPPSYGREDNPDVCKSCGGISGFGGHTDDCPTGKFEDQWHQEVFEMLRREGKLEECLEVLP